MADANFKRILIFNPFGIGDVIFSTPLVRVLKDKFPGCRIHYICNKRVRPILKNDPNIDDILIFEKDDFRNMAKRSKIKFIIKLVDFMGAVKNVKADLMIDLSLNYQASFFSKILGIPRRIGFNYRNRGRFLTDKLDLKGFDHKHVVLYYLDMLKLLDINAEDIFPKIHTSPYDDEQAESFMKENRLSGRFVVGVIPGGGRSWGEKAHYRRWPISHFAHVVDRLIDAFDISVILFGDKNEAKICDQMQSFMRNDVINVGGKTTVEQFMGLLKKCRFVLCNEGGPLHIAVALGVPTVSIFGPVDENIYGPFSFDISKHMIVTDRTRCSPCYSRFKHKECDHLYCLNAISEDKVFGASKILFQRVMENGGKGAVKT